MTASPRWTIWCDWRSPDGDHCPQWTGSEDTAPDARAYARRGGWKIAPRSQGGDLCPRHAGRPGRVGGGMTR